MRYDDNAARTIASKKATELARVALAYFDGAFVAAHRDGGVELRRLPALMPAGIVAVYDGAHAGPPQSVSSHGNLIARCTQRRCGGQPGVIGRVQHGGSKVSATEPATAHGRVADVSDDIDGVRPYELIAPGCVQAVAGSHPTVHPKNSLQ
jgi:hypothetical protein